MAERKRFTRRFTPKPPKKKRRARRRRVVYFVEGGDGVFHDRAWCIEGGAAKVQRQNKKTLPSDVPRHHCQEERIKLQREDDRGRS
jgi:hypothetical protein